MSVETIWLTQHAFDWLDDRIASNGPSSVVAAAQWMWNRPRIEVVKGLETWPDSVEVVTSDLRYLIPAHPGDDRRWFEITARQADALTTSWCQTREVSHLDATFDDRRWEDLDEVIARCADRFDLEREAFEVLAVQFPMGCYRASQDHQWTSLFDTLSRWLDSDFVSGARWMLKRSRSMSPQRTLQLYQTLSTQLVEASKRLPRDSSA